MAATVATRTPRLYVIVILGQRSRYVCTRRPMTLDQASKFLMDRCAKTARSHYFMDLADALALLDTQAQVM